MESCTWGAARAAPQSEEGQASLSATGRKWANLKVDRHLCSTLWGLLAWQMQCTRTPYTPCLRVPPHVFHHSAQHLQAGPRNYGRAPATPDPEAGGCAEADKQSGCAGGGVGAPGWCRRICTRGAALRPSLQTRRSQRRPWGAALCWRTPPSQARSPLLGAPLHSAAAETESPSACIVPFTCAVRSPARIAVFP